MSNAYAHPPFEAYKGNDPYVFVSYSHKDSEAVFQELQELRQSGYRVWYDEGIDPGNEWPEEVAAALSGAEMFLVFISTTAVASQNVRNEINFAINNRKPFLAVHLVETDLPAGLQLRMGDIQAIMKHRMPIEGYRRKLQKALPLTLRIPGHEIEPAEVALGPRKTVAVHFEEFAENVSGKPTGAKNPALASRQSRLGAAILDALITASVVYPLVFAVMTLQRESKQPSYVFFGQSAILVIAAYLFLHGYFLASRGQSLGKMIAGIRIVDYESGTILPLGKLFGLRVVPVAIVTVIPLLAVIDVIYMFRSDQRCVHDHIAGTKVVQA